MPKGIFHLRVAQISHRRYFTRRKAYFTQIWVYRRATNPNLKNRPSRNPSEGAKNYELKSLGYREALFFLTKKGTTIAA